MGSLAAAFGRLAGISGYNVSDIEQLEYVAQMTDIKVGELLYAGILISALGAIMDVAMSVSSAVHEVAARHRSWALRSCSGPGSMWGAI